MTVPRPEHPRPQFVRPDWRCLNGDWQFAFDPGDSGFERGLVTTELPERIVVPFCPEAPLSGIGDPDYHPAVWYRRAVTVPTEWTGRRVVLRFQAVDYDATVWVDGVEVARHRGSAAPFAADITDRLGPDGTATIVVRARDDHRQGDRPLGKQSSDYGNQGCRYTRTTGIWQTVWLEAVPARHLLRPRVTPDVAGSRFVVEQPVRGAVAGDAVRARVRIGDRVVAEATAGLAADFSALLVLPVADPRLWCPEDPFLYDLDLELIDGGGAVVDAVASYAGLRGLAIRDGAVLLNGSPVFQRLVLDQGYYPDGILTAPDDAALVRDIELSQAAGFNGARLHQKVFEERFLYHADRLGYLVWGEFHDWRGGGNQRRTVPYPMEVAAQWAEVLARDYSHPAIVGWCPLNETMQELVDRIDILQDPTWALFLAAKNADRTRPVLDTSGYSHRVAETDVYDCHDYEQDPAKLAAHHAALAAGTGWFSNDEAGVRRNVPYAGQPFFVSEFGGAWWNATEAAKADAGKCHQDNPAGSGWGYGNRVADVEDFHARFAGLCTVLLDHPRMFGYCYTQLTDVFQEQNGVLAFDRTPKFDLARLKAAQDRVAAIER